MQSSLSLKDRDLKLIFGAVGFGVPIIFIILQVIFGFSTLPLMVLMFSWFGIALLMYLGLSEK
ncbi:MAG: hypothetical protein AYK23_01875 [Candidatus Proteinoplasmatales archaeon SG8-5]|nr:MAG: hypothetical protein AYK23_01875 [Candidatus Proteinoplasmatales archaeon SG8-5]